MSRILTCVAAMVVAACEAPVGPLVIQTGPSSLLLTNRSDSSLYYFIVERESSALIDWIACESPSCPRVGSHSAKTIPYSQIAGYSDGEREAILYWWRLVPAAAGGFRFDSIRAMAVGL